MEARSALLKGSSVYWVYSLLSSLLLWPLHTCTHCPNTDKICLTSIGEVFLSTWLLSPSSVVDAFFVDVNI